MTYRPFSHYCSFPVPNFGTFKKMHEKTSGKTVFPEVDLILFNYCVPGAGTFFFFSNYSLTRRFFIVYIQLPPFTPLFLAKNKVQITSVYIFFLKQHILIL